MAIRRTQDMPPPRPSARYAAWSSIRLKPKTSAGLTTVGQLVFTVCVFSLAAATGFGGDILPQIPADAKMVVIIRDPAGFAERVNRLVCRIKPDSPPRNVQSLFSSFRLPPNSIDDKEPVALAFLPGGIGNSLPVLIFRPRSEVRWPTPDPEQPVTVARLDGTCFGRDDGWVFASESQRPVLRALRGKTRRSLSQVLGDREKSLLDECDTLVRVRMDAWQPEIGQALGMIRVFGNMGAMGSDDLQSRAQAAAIGWFADGVGKVAGDMSVMDLGLKLDDEGARFIHYHAFKPDSGVANYLKSITRVGGDIWRGLERRPFLFAFAWDAKTKHDSGIMQDLVTRMMKVPGMECTTTQPAMVRLLGDCEKFYRRERASATLVDFTKQGHLGILGVKDFDNAAEGVQLLRRISEDGSQVMDAFAPSWASGGEFRSVKRGGLDVLEMSFTSCKLDGKNRAMMEAIYGKDALYQIAPLGKDTLAYAISTDNSAIEKLASAACGKSPSVGKFPAVAAITRILPRDPCMVAFIDVKRATRFLPAFSKADETLEVGKKHITLRSAGPDSRPMLRPREQNDLPDSAGPLIGWAMTSGPDWVRGEAYMSQDDIVKSVPLLKRMSQDFKDAEAKPAPQMRRMKVRVVEQKGE